MTCPCELTKALSMLYSGQKLQDLLTQARQVSNPTTIPQILAHMQFEEQYIVPYLRSGVATKILSDHKIIRQEITAGRTFPVNLWKEHGDYEKQFMIPVVVNNSKFSSTG